MNLTHIHRSITAARHTNRPLQYATRNGHLHADLTAGRIIRVSTFAHRLGLNTNWTDRYASPLGRAIAKAHRTTAGTEPLRCWIRNDAGHWIRVAVYRPTNPALTAGAAAYKRTAHLADRAAYAECA